MVRIVLIYGLVSGLVIVGGILATIVFNGGAPHSNVFLGYLIMLVAMSSILVGVKQHRDQALGGVIRFWPALGLGLAIAAVASLAYILVWEIYLAATDYSFMATYTEQLLEQKRAAGVTGAAYEKLAADMAKMTETYRNPLFRMPMTFVEIFPVGLLLAVVSAALLRNPRFLPARARTTA